MDLSNYAVCEKKNNIEISLAYLPVEHNRVELLQRTQKSLNKYGNTAKITD